MIVLLTDGVLIVDRLLLGERIGRMHGIGQRVLLGLVHHVWVGGLLLLSGVLVHVVHVVVVKGHLLLFDLILMSILAIG